MIFDFMTTGFIESPIGFVVIHEENEKICSIGFSDNKPDVDQQSDLLDLTKNQLKAYFKGELQDFSFPISQRGTDFQQSVWNTLVTIKYAEIISYTHLANKMKNLLAIRAIAAANGKNKIMIAIPCHRVVGLTGEMTGYAGEIWRKKWLLDHESKIAGVGQASLFI